MKANYILYCLYKANRKEEVGSGKLQRSTLPILPHTFFKFLFLWYQHKLFYLRAFEKNPKILLAEVMSDRRIACQTPAGHGSWVSADQGFL